MFQSKGGTWYLADPDQAVKIHKLSEVVTKTRSLIKRGLVKAENLPQVRQELKTARRNLKTYLAQLVGKDKSEKPILA